MPEVENLPVGEIVQPMERGQVTIPAKYRKELGITSSTYLNLFEWRGMVVIVPIGIKSKIKPARPQADWVKEPPAEYIDKVRYNPLEELWVKMAQKNSNW